jgi:hypothetical protein
MTMLGSVASRISTVFTVGLAALCLLFTPIDSEAQLTRGSVSGTVTDSEDAAISGVTVTLRNKDTGVTEAKTTNEVGIYRFTAVESGMYSVEFRKKGFEPQETPVLVTTALERTINRVLPASSVDTAIEVIDPGVSLSKTTPTIEQTWSTRVVLEVPTMDAGALIRELTRFALTAPSVSRVPGQNGFAVAGNRGRNNNFMHDGVDNNEGTVTLPAAEIPPEAVAEIQLQLAGAGHASEQAQRPDGDTAVCAQSLRRGDRRSGHPEPNVLLCHDPGKPAPGIAERIERNRSYNPDTGRLPGVVNGPAAIGPVGGKPSGHAERALLSSSDSHAARRGLSDFDAALRIHFGVEPNR